MSIEQKLKKSIANLCLGGVLVASSGCAFFDRHLTLDYSPPPISSPQVKDVQVNVDIFSDENGEVIGCVRNAYGWKTAKVKADNNLGEWLRDSLTIELRNYGCDIITEGDPRLRGTFKKLYTDLYMKYDTDLSFVVELWNNNEKVYLDNFDGNAKKTALFVTGDEYKKVSKMAMQDALRKATPKIIHQLELLKNKKE